MDRTSIHSNNDLLTLNNDAHRSLIFFFSVVIVIVIIIGPDVPIGLRLLPEEKSQVR